MKAASASGTADRILECARKLCTRNGPGALSMRRVASCAGISPTAIYRHYASKEDLLSAVAAAGHDLLAGYLSKAANGSSAPERLRAITDAYLRFALEHSQFYRVLFMTPPPELGAADRPDDRGDRLGAMAGYVVEDLQSFIDAGVVAGDDADELALTLWSQCHGLVSLYLVDPGRRSRDDFERRYRRSIDRLLGALAVASS